MLAMRVPCLLFLAITSHVAYVGAADCFDDMTSCLGDLRGLMTSESAFWFGQDYEDRCVEGGKRSERPDCDNPGLGLSVLARFLNITQVPAGAAFSLEMADVVYNAPEGTYYGCDQKTYVPPVYNYRLDPLKITELNSWSLTSAPSVTWTPKDDSTYYTVLLWDVGYMYIHGFYLNAQKGRVDTGTPIVPYSGPKNPSPTGNVYLFAVIEQTVYVDPATVGIAIGGILNANGLRFHPTALLAAIPNTWAEPTAVNLMSVRGDTYSVEWQKKRYIVNYCPWLLSQESGIRTVLNEAKIPVFWSYEMSNGNSKGPLYAEQEPFLFSLTVDLNVEYSSEELTVESCCVKTTYTDAMYRVSPYEITIPAVTRNEPRVEMTPVSFLDWTQRPTDKHYTLMMVDMSDAVHQKMDHNFVIHWLVTDISGADVNTGNVVLPHQGPLTLLSYSADTMVFLLFEQDEPELENFDISDYVGFDCRDFLTGRCRAKISNIVNDYDLKLAGINWYQAEQDAYARKMIYERLIIQPMVNVCDGLDGFEDPCPVYGVCTAHASAIVPSLGLVLLVAVSTISKLL